MVHIGKQIEEIVRQKKIGITELASLLGKSRPGIYDMFTRETIDTGVLKKLCAILDFDFFQYYHTNTRPETPQVQEEFVKYQLKNTTPEMERIVQMLKEKEMALEAALKEIVYLKRINQLLEDRLKDK